MQTVMLMMENGLEVVSMGKALMEINTGIFTMVVGFKVKSMERVHSLLRTKSPGTAFGRTGL